MQLFPAGKVINLHPWEYNEVPVLLGAALRTDAPIVVLHLTRPPITIPDRQALGIPSHFAAAGAPTWSASTPGPAEGRRADRAGHQRHGQHASRSCRSSMPAG